MQEIKIGTSTCRDEQGASHTFQYTLLIRTLPAGRFAFEEYGISVAEASGEEVRIPHITHSRSQADTLLALLVEHCVSPTALWDVVEDWANENHLPQPKPQQVVELY